MSLRILNPRLQLVPVVLIALVGLVSGAATAFAISSRTLFTPTGALGGDYLGISVGTAGDVNGDGYADLIVGAYANDAGGTDAGRAYVYYGGPSADATPGLTLTGAAPTDYFGYSVGSAGDVDGDGYADLIVGAYANDAGGTDAGRAYVYYGGPSADATPDLTLTGAAAADRFGYSVGTAGDVNGDGYADLIVGAYANDAGGTDAGRAYVYYGGPSADATPDLTLTGAAAADAFGYSVGTAGDVNRDGYADLIVGAYANDAGAVDAGRAYVYYGGPSADANADLTLTGAASGDYFGYSVATAGDVNSDGYADLIVGAKFNDAGGTEAGRAYVYFGGPAADAAADLTLTGAASGDQFGYSVGTAGDVNGDGYADLIVGAPIAGGVAGRAYVYFGGPAADAATDLPLTGAASGDQFGYSVGTAGDMNGDGYADFVVSAWGNDAGGPSAGRAYVTTVYPYQVLSPNGGEQWVAGEPATVNWLGHDVADLAVSFDGGASWSTLASGVGGEEQNVFALTAPSTTTDFAKIRLSYTSQAATHATSDASDGVFRIVRSVATTPFVHESVDTTGNVGSHTRLVLDALGNPHICYWDGTNFDLKYASMSGGTWTLETVDGTGDVGTSSSLALDAQDNPHISYYDFTNGDLKYASRSGGAWTLETVDAAGSVGISSSLALDALGNPHISYWDATNADLKYARKSGGTWTFETVDATGSVGDQTSLALDARGDPRISYRDVTNADLKYASKSGGAWTLETVDAAGSVGDRTSLALDAQGNPRISYRDVTHADLKYASKSGGHWTLETVDAADDVGDYTSLALDAQGSPRISYYDVTHGDLKYASKSSGSWAIETVDAAGTVGQRGSLALDAQGNPRISYYDQTNGDLKYTSAAVHLVSPLGGERWAAGSQQTVRWSGVGPVDIEISQDGGDSYTTLLSGVIVNEVAVDIPDLSTEHARIRIQRASPLSTSITPGYLAVAADLVSPWWTTIVDAPGDVGWYTSLALDARDNPHTSYRDNANNDLKYASKSGSGWTVETVDAGGIVGWYTSLALDRDGNPRIAYFDDTNDDLKYARKSGGSWSIETVDGGAVGSSPVSLALDAQGNPSISYQDGGALDLRYARKSGGVWTLETVDAGGSVGRYSSLALDAQGNPHISYYDDTNGDLKYARKSGGVWVLETVDASGVTGAQTSLALDTQGSPHISYIDVVAADLRYASKVGGVWSLQTVDAPENVGYQSSLAVDADGNAHISYNAFTGFDLRYASEDHGRWTIETVDATGSVGQYTSLALDAQGNPRICYYDLTNGDLKYASAAVELAEPAPGAMWPVGASRTVTWDGTGRVALSLSVDGGNTWQLQQPRLTGGEYRLQVPHTPSRFARLKLERAVPYSVALTDLFTIQTSVSLLSFAASLVPEGGAELSWRSDPGPADLAGYRLESADGSVATGWRTLVALTRETRYRDEGGAPGSTYRLLAVNGLGEELVLGEVSLLPARPLAAWPLPYHSGTLNVSFATAGGLGGGKGWAEVMLFDLSGRRVRTLARGNFEPGYHLVAWDGRDGEGRRLAQGIYFLRSQSGGQTARIKLVVMP